MYADDTIIYVTAETSHLAAEMLTRQLLSVSQWLQDNFLTYKLQQNSINVSLFFTLFMTLFHIVSCSKTHYTLTGDGTTWNLSCATRRGGHVTYHFDLCGARVWLASPCSLSPLTTSCHPTSWEAADTVCV